MALDENTSIASRVMILLQIKSSHQEKCLLNSENIRFIKNISKFNKNYA
jgi:hypothetical protein